MEENKKHLILHVDDSPDLLALTRRWLEIAGYEVATASSARDAASLLNSITPDLVLLDVLMPGMDGYEFCARLHRNQMSETTPIVFLTAQFLRQDKARALAVGAVDFLVKPVRQEHLIETVKKHLTTPEQWKKLGTHEGPPGRFRGFLSFLQTKFEIAPELVHRITVEDVYSLAVKLAISEGLLAQFIAQYLNIPYLLEIDPMSVALGVLPASFCKAHKVIPINEGDKRAFVVANPFSLYLIDKITKLFGSLQTPRFLVTEPENISQLFEHYHL